MSKDGDRRKSEASLTEDDVREEHMRSVNPAAHWLYLFGALGAGLVAMIGLIALLGGIGG
ncbi:MAG TPA: hypothetical protein VH723_02125 [Candidatus Limnocylindrales bacterium]|jgi:hypothetical protein